MHILRQVIPNQSKRLILEFQFEIFTSRDFFLNVFNIFVAITIAYFFKKFSYSYESNDNSSKKMLHEGGILS